MILTDIKTKELKDIIRKVIQEELINTQNNAKIITHKPLYTNKEILALLNVNTKTLKKYRDNGWLGYSQVGDKFYYSADDINSFLTNTHQNAFAWN